MLLKFCIAAIINRLINYHAFIVLEILHNAFRNIFLLGWSVHDWIDNDTFTVHFWFAGSTLILRFIKFINLAFVGFGWRCVIGGCLFIKDDSVRYLTLRWIINSIGDIFPILRNRLIHLLNAFIESHRIKKPKFTLIYAFLLDYYALFLLT